MADIAARLDALVRSLGSTTAGFGLFGIAFFDSSLLSLPEINDLLLVYFGTRFSDNAYYYAAMTVLGSAAGASLLYWLARWKGYGYLKRKFGDGKIESVFALFRRYGVLAVAVPAVLPPPFPFKIFVLSSGVLGLSYGRFLVAIFIGRCVRYFGEAFLAVRYGERAIAYLKESSTNVLVAALVAGAVGAGVLFAMKRFRAAEGRAG